MKPRNWTVIWIAVVFAFYVACDVAFDRLNTWAITKDVIRDEFEYRDKVRLEVQEMRDGAIEFRFQSFQDQIDRLYELQK